MKNKLGVFLLSSVMVTALLGGWFGKPLTAGPPLESDTTRLLKTFAVALAAAQKHYVEPVPTEELVESAIHGLLRTFDPHSSFFSVSNYNRLQEEQRGRYYGLGITIRAESPGSGRVAIMEPPSPGTPAYKVGLRAGDVISKIEGTPIDDWDLNGEVIPNLKGPKGTPVNITIERPGEGEAIELTVIRDEISLYTIKYVFRLGQGIGYVRINKFSETTGDELDEAMAKLDEESLTGLVLDLRDNPGGALSQALAVSDRFLKKGQVIVSTLNRSGRGREFRAKEGGKYKYPMVVLINRNSASASEIVSGALQDHDRALIVGETSFGKALVQTVFPLEGNRGLALTTGKYLTPSNRLIQRDYSSSFYEYYLTRSDNPGAESKDFQTDSGRTVFGGGGIRPDQEVALDSYSSLVRMINRKQFFVAFAAKLVDGDIQSDTQYQFDRKEQFDLTEEERRQRIEALTMTDHTLQLFEEFLKEEEVDLTHESFEEDREVIANRLKREVVLSLFGDEQGFRVALRIDNQLQKAIDFLPDAMALMQNNDVGL
ncbi:MAG: S41 family peptidase [Acidobacteriota bacterium]|nr:S41 family peptidase [Acidobacteriota bacterium]